MIRPFTLVTVLMAAGSGLYLYQSKHNAQMLDREIAHTLQSADAARQRGGLLRAEYELQSDPTRLQDLAQRYLTLKDTAPTQFTNFAELDRRLPAVRQVQPDAAPVEETAPPNIPLPDAPALVATAAPVTSPAPRQPAAPMAVPAAHLTPVRAAAPAPVPQPSRPAPAPVPPGYVGNFASAIRPVAARTPSPTYIRNDSAPMVGSALGMARVQAATPVSINSTDDVGGRQ